MCRFITFRKCVYSIKWNISKNRKYSDMLGKHFIKLND